MPPSPPSGTTQPHRYITHNTPRSHSTSRTRSLWKCGVQRPTRETAKFVMWDGKEEYEGWYITQEHWLPPYLTVISKTSWLHVEARGKCAGQMLWKQTGRFHSDWAPPLLWEVCAPPTLLFFSWLFIPLACLFFFPLVFQLGFVFLLLQILAQPLFSWI